GQEAPENGGMADAGVVAVLHPLQNLLLAQGDQQSALETFQWTIKPRSLFTLEISARCPCGLAYSCCWG
ncbi:MAG: hypothetical protein DSY79_05495, partial [Chloroflexi bacterium]